MATTTLTKNLKLKISSDLTADAKSNLLKLDELGSIYQVNTNQVANIRSATSIVFSANDIDLGGSGVGGTISFGSVNQPLTSLNMYVSDLNIAGGFSLNDVAVGGTKKLSIVYKSDISGAVNTTADRILNLDLEDADRNIILGGDFTLSGGNLSLTLLSNTSWTLPIDNGISGQVLTTDGDGVLTWTSALGNSNGFESTYTWIPADGNVKTIDHNLSTRQIHVTVLDINNDYKDIEISDITRPNDNQIVLTSTSAPIGGNWLVLLKQFLTN